MRVRIVCEKRLVRLGAVGLMARREIRRRWRGVLALALLVAIVGTVVLATTAAARQCGRTRARDLGAPATRRVRHPQDARVQPSASSCDDCLAGHHARRRRCRHRHPARVVRRCTGLAARGRFARDCAHLTDPRRAVAPSRATRAGAGQCRRVPTRPGGGANSTSGCVAFGVRPVLCRPTEGD